MYGMCESLPTRSDANSTLDNSKDMHSLRIILGAKNQKRLGVEFLADTVLGGIDD
jgi:hypothetical protein